MAYTIQPGDTLAKISQKTGISQSQLIRMNGGLVDLSKGLFKGDTIRTKGGEAVSTPKSVLRAKSPISKEQQVINASIKNSMQVKKFEDLYKFSDFYNKDLNNAALQQQSNGYYEPLVDKALKDVAQTYANNGLYRSGLRGKAMGDTSDQYTKQQDTQLLADAQGMYDNASKWYQSEKKTFDTTDPTKYTGLTEQAPAQLTPLNIQTPSYTQALDKYSQFGQTENAPYSFSQGYQNFKKKYKSPFDALIY
jgi:LysM repeat protein